MCWQSGLMLSGTLSRAAPVEWWGQWGEEAVNGESSSGVAMRGADKWGVEGEVVAERREMLQRGAGVGSGGGGREGGSLPS